MNTKITWARYNHNGYECSSKGDKRFSAFYAKIGSDTIEYLYQVIIKGYPSIKEGKGKPPLIICSSEELYRGYKNLWKIWARKNPELMVILKEQAGFHNYCLTDMFATSDVNQARALSELLNEENYEIGNRDSNNKS